MRHPVLCIVGPTASGKTDLALRLADRLPVSLISLDSTMIYRAMDIGTAKPDAQTLKKYPHALVDIRNPDESYSVGEFVREVRAEIEHAHALGKLPLLVGGSLMYYNALSHGLSELPEGEASIRQKILNEGELLGWPVLHERLKAIDPKAYARIKPHDKQRIVRALEVFLQTGKSLSSFWEAPRTPVFAAYQMLSIALIPPARAMLHQKIALRARILLDAGLLEEVKKIITQWPRAESMPSMRAVGYRQSLDFLKGKLDSQEALLESIIIATRQLAKHQLTWLRKFQGVQEMDCTQPNLDKTVMDFILARNLLNSGASQKGHVT